MNIKKFKNMANSLHEEKLPIKNWEDTNSLNGNFTNDECITLYEIKIYEESIGFCIINSIGEHIDIYSAMLVSDESRIIKSYTATPANNIYLKDEKYISVMGETIFILPDGEEKFNLSFNNILFDDSDHNNFHYFSFLNIYFLSSRLTKPIQLYYSRIPMMSYDFFDNLIKRILDSDIIHISESSLFYILKLWEREKTSIFKDNYLNLDERILYYLDLYADKYNIDRNTFKLLFEIL